MALHSADVPKTDPKRLAGWFLALFVVSVIVRYNELATPWFEMDSKAWLVVLNGGIDAVLGALVVWLSPAAKSLGIK